VRVRLHIGYAKVLLPSRRSKAHAFARSARKQGRELLMIEQRINRRLAAILAADVVGYSRLMGADEAGTLSALKRHREAVFDPAVAAHNGRIVKLIGDGVIAEFGSVVDAVNCALSVQRSSTRTLDQSASQPAIVLRIGINLGDVIIEGDDIYGDGVNIAARLEPLAEPGGICVSSIVNESVGNRIDVRFQDSGEISVKNIDRPIRVWKWHPGATTPAAARSNAAKPDASVAAASIAVLPFTNMSGDPEQEYFSDGVSEDVITDLSKIAGLTVIARNSSFTYKGRSVDVRTIGRDLGARSVLQGSIRRAGNRVRITAQLIDAVTGAHLWADRYDRDLTDIFEVQDEVVEKIVDVLAVTLTQGEQQRLRRHGTSNVEAYEYWLRARALLTRGTRDSIVQARAMYRRAIESDLNFAAPHAGLALAAIADYASGWALDSAQALIEAERWARRALELNDQEPVSHMALGNVLLWRREHEGALAEFDRTIALDPNFAQGHAARGLALMYASEPSRALEPFAKAMRLDPHYPDIVLHFLAQANFSLEKYEIAAEELLDRIARNPGTDASRMLLASCYGHLGRAVDARGVWAELLKVNPDFSLMQRARVLPYKNPGDFLCIVEGLAKAGLP
jgi:adenylate cyclase